MEKTFEIILDKAKAFCRDETDLMHIVNACEMAKKLISLEGGDESIIIPAIIMHDMGWHIFSYAEELKARGPTALKRIELNHKHEVEGARLAQNILSEINYPEEEKKKIIEIIIGHDNRSKPVSKEDMIVKDADRLARYTPECFDTFRLKFKYSEREYFDFLKSKLDRWLFTDSARFLAREYLLKRRMGNPEVEFSNDIRSNLYKILIRLEGEVIKTVKLSFEKIAITAVKEKVYDVKRMIELYLSDHRYIDVKRLQQDEKFQSIAVQKVGEGGYIGIIDREIGCIIFHPNRKIINLPLEELKEKERPSEYLHGFWDWYERARKGEEFFSYYQGKNEKDEIVDKFQYVVPLDIKNAKWSLNAAASYDEFFRYTDILNKEIVQSVSVIADQIGHLAEQVEQRTKELAESNKGLQKEINEREKAEKIQAKLIEEIESVNRELRDFAYIVSHDLKAPLRGINTLTKWISTDYADKFDQKGKEQMALLSNRADRMYNLIDGILQYSRVGRVKEEKTQVNLNELVPDIIDILAPPENIIITVENELPVIECEETRITQVFQNLLSNAIKYMDKPQGQIRVGCIEEDGCWKFSVADNGPGIEEKYFDKIFQMFQTLSPRDEVESTGVGLTVVKKIIEIYEGRIWVESKVDEGSTFLFTLPKQMRRIEDAKLETSIIN